MNKDELLEIIKNNHWVWDDLIEPIRLIELDRFTYSNINWTFDNVANRHLFDYYPHNPGKGTHRFWGATLYSDISNDLKPPIAELDENMWDFTRWLLGFVQSKFNNCHIKLVEIQLNGQSMGMDGTTHVDTLTDTNPDLDYTLMYFPNSEWGKDWGGEFQFMDKIDKNEEDKPQVLKSLDYIPGRLILFKASIPHRGLAPLKPYILRKSIVWRLNIKNK